MRYAVFVIPAGVLGMYLAPVGRPATLEEKLEFASDYFNRHGGESIPSQFGKVRVESDVIDKDTIVVRILDVPTGYYTLDPNAVRRLSRAELCKLSNVRDLFASGAKIRMEFVSNIGVELTAFQLAQC